MSSEHLAPLILYTYLYVIYVYIYKPPHIHNIHLFIYCLFPPLHIPPPAPALGCQPHKSKDSVHLQAQCSEGCPSAVTSCLRGRCTQPSALGCLQTCAAQGTLLQSAPQGFWDTPLPRKLPLTPPVPSLLVRSLSPEELYLAWGRAVWL